MQVANQAPCRIRRITINVRPRWTSLGLGEMLARICDQIIVAEEEAILARFKAKIALSPQIRQEYEQLEQRWLQLAQTLQFATSISGFLEWRAQRLDPPPP